jgi:hypothetical protein
VEAQD